MRCIYEYYKDGIELKKSQVSKIIKDATDKHPLFKPLAKQMNLHRVSEREDLLQRLYDIYHCGADTGFSGLIGCMDMSRFFDDNEDDMLEWLKQEAELIGCSSTLAYLGDYLGADLDDYKWRAVQALASYLAIDIMESEI
jgi:hypothetical protein|nr:MAG TPA: hypothetical protein [Caudoviricetes sp.]